MSKAPPATERARGATLGLGAFEKISAVEGLRLTPEMKRDLQQLDAAPMTAAERTRFITAKYGQPAHPRTGLEKSNIYDTILSGDR